MKDLGNEYRVNLNFPIVEDEGRTRLYYLGPVGSSIVHKDNDKSFIRTNYGFSHDKVRFPSIKRSMNVWKNFYRLFPHVYVMMREHVQDEKVGDVIEIECNGKKKVRVFEGMEIEFGEGTAGYLYIINDKKKEKLNQKGLITVRKY